MGFEIQTYILGDLQTNCYLVIDDHSQECAVIDPADDASFISDQILSQNLKLTKIIATHGHFDHNMGAAELQLNFDVPYFLHQDDQFLIKDLANSASYWLNRKVELKPPVVSNYLKDGEIVLIGEIELKVLHTPGHTPGGCVLINEAEKLAFTGDTLFANQVQGRTDLSYSSQTKMDLSLKKIFKKLAGYRGLPGHGEEFVI